MWVGLENKMACFPDVQYCIYADTVVQSICTHYSSLSGRPDIFLGCGTYFGPDLFQGHKPTHVFKTRIVGAD